MKDYNDGGFDFYGESYGRNDGFEGKNYLQNKIYLHYINIVFSNLI
jgi:hypothetical protein